MRKLIDKTLRRKVTIMTNQWLTQSISYKTNVVSNRMFVFLWFCSITDTGGKPQRNIAASSFIERHPTNTAACSCNCLVLRLQKNQPIFIQNNYCCQNWHVSACADYFPLLCGDICLQSVPSRWLALATLFPTASFWLGTPCLLLLSQSLWGLATAHWRSYMTVKRAINAGREAEVYGCFSLP